MISLVDIGGDLGYLISNYFIYFLRGTASTLILSIFGTVVGLIIGVFLAFGRNIPVVKYICAGYSIIFRGTPMMVQALIFKYGTQMMGVNWNLILPSVPVFNGWLIAGLIVITLNTAAYMCEIIRSGLNGVGKGQIEGARSLGLTPFQTLIHVSLPQALRNSLPTIGNEWIVNIKDSSVLNVIGVTELFFEAQDAANKGYRFLAAYILLSIIYLILTLSSTGVLKLVEMKMDGRKFKFNFFHFKERGNA